MTTVMDVNLQIDGQAVAVRRSVVAELIDLRHRVLRAGLPREQAMFPGDDLPGSFHFGAFTEANLCVGCASFHLSTWEDQPAYQLRGMATEPAWKGKGVGTQVLTLGVQTIKATSPIQVFWCNARLIAIPFYEKLGWKIVSERFEIPTAGPHHRMLLTPTIPTPR
jgi:predicted GNAT family N-acyltransferase